MFIKIRPESRRSKCCTPVYSMYKVFLSIHIHVYINLSKIQIPVGKKIDLNKSPIGHIYDKDIDPAPAFSVLVIL